jgi:hypothetical protein
MRSIYNKVQQITLLPLFMNSYIFRSEHIVNTTLQNNIKMQYISIEYIYIYMGFTVWITTVIVFGHSAAGSYRTVLQGLISCVLVKLKYWESMIKLLDDICEIAVQLSVHILHTVYRYVNCCMWHEANIAICSLIRLV